jgi:hypothetical protein
MLARPWTLALCLLGLAGPACREGAISARPDGQAGLEERAAEDGGEPGAPEDDGGPGLDDAGPGLDDAGPDASDGGDSPTRVYRVGPGRPWTAPCQLAGEAEDGALLEIDAGDYPGDACIWRQNDLTLRGLGGLARLDATGHTLPNRKAIWVLAGARTTVESIEFLGAAVPDRNGAGIRLEGPGLRVSGCRFANNENGILAGDQADSDVWIEHSEFVENGAGDGYSHNLYINHVRSLTFVHNLSHRARVGHNLKSRALANWIAYNRLMDEAEGNASYVVDLPNGGRSALVGNLLQQGPRAENSSLVSYGREGLGNPDPRLVLVNYTLVNDRSAGIFLNLQAGAQARLVNNLFVGPGSLVQGEAEQVASLRGEDADLVDRAGYDYRLRPGAPAEDAGSAPGTLDEEDLTPRWQYLHPAGREPRPEDGALDIGAYELP